MRVDGAGSTMTRWAWGVCFRRRCQAHPKVQVKGESMRVGGGVSWVRADTCAARGRDPSSALRIARPCASAGATWRWLGWKASGNAYQWRRLGSEIRASPLWCSVRSTRGSYGAAFYDAPPAAGGVRPEVWVTTEECVDGTTSSMARGHQINARSGQSRLGGFDTSRPARREWGQRCPHARGVDGENALNAIRTDVRVCWCPDSVADCRLVDCVKTDYVRDDVPILAIRWCTELAEREVEESLALVPYPVLDLPPEIWTLVFTACDIPSVVSTAQTCRHLYDLAFQKCVWLVLVEDLRKRSFLDVQTTNLEGLSAEGLVRLVKRVITGPELWSSDKSDCVPHVRQRIILHPSIPRAPSIVDAHEAKLTLNGRFVFYNRQSVLQCWDIVLDTLVWTHEPALANSAVLAFAVDDTRGDDSILLMICQRTMMGVRDRENFIEIVDLNPRSGSHRTLLTAGSTPSDHDNPFLEPMICGVLAAVAVTGIHRQNGYLVLDWGDQSCFVLDRDGNDMLRLAIIPGHLIVKTLANSVFHCGEDYLYLISARDVLETHGGRIPGPHETSRFRSVNVDQFPKILTQRFPSSSIAPSYPTCGHELTVYPRPLHLNSYRIWVSNTRIDNELSFDDSLLCSYDLSLSPSQSPHWCERTRVPILGDLEAITGRLSIPYLSYSGHRYTLRPSWPTANIQITQPTTDLFPGTIALRHCRDHVHVSSYSGALAYTTNTTIVILYIG
ncbi:hypothetical protein C8R47DRAFT_1329018 [Mycena vitilis]|nr:hypothetical protein C8R47DRAFT_1329018 [Mycena vitilis]